MSRLLLDDQPLLVMPKLATKIGLNEAIILQQIHYWNEINKKTGNNYKDGHYWTFNSYADWQEQFPFWSIPTIQRAISNLEKLKLVVTGNYNKLKIDRTKWYRIDYKVLEILENSPIYQIDKTNISKWYDELIKMMRPLPEITPENNSENNIYSFLPKGENRFLDIYLDYFGSYMKAMHMKVRVEKIDEIINTLNTIEVEIDEYEFIEKVIDHFDNLPKSNNGNILAFLTAIKRYFDVAV